MGWSRGLGVGVWVQHVTRCAKCPPTGRGGRPDRGHSVRPLAARAGLAAEFRGATCAAPPKRPHTGVACAGALRLSSTGGLGPLSMRHRGPGVSGGEGGREGPRPPQNRWGLPGLHSPSPLDPRPSTALHLGPRVHGPSAGAEPLGTAWPVAQGAQDTTGWSRVLLSHALDAARSY